MHPIVTRRLCKEILNKPSITTHIFTCLVTSYNTLGHRKLLQYKIL